MDNGYIVRFMRSDDLPDEEYSHCSDADALAQYTSQQPESNDVYLQFSLLRLAAIPVPSKQRFCWHYPMKNARLYQK